MWSKLAVAGVATAVALSTLNSPAQAVWGGEEVIGSERVVALMASQTARESFCSAAMLSDQVILSVSHCTSTANASDGSLRFHIDEWWVAQPGADIKVDDITTRVKVLRIWMPPSYAAVWTPERSDWTQFDDLAFLFLEKPLSRGYSVPIASDADVARIRRDGLPIIHFGYGMQTSTTNDGKPYRVELSWKPAYREQVIGSFGTGGKGLCPGDSGGPWYAQIDGVLKIVAAQSRGNGCAGVGPIEAIGTLLHPRLDWLRSSTEDFLMDEAVLRDNWKSRLDAKASYDAALVKWTADAKASGRYFRDDGCHGRGLQATLEIKTNGSWQDLMAATGWASDNSCPDTNPVQPYAIADVPSGTQYRWRVFVPGGWEWFSRDRVVGPMTGPLPAKPAPVVPAQAALPSANKSAAVTPTIPVPAPTATVKAVAKASTITCVKGKTIKKVSAVKPTCPKGYRKR
jgi:hypothetical protein